MAFDFRFGGDVLNAPLAVHDVCRYYHRCRWRSRSFYRGGLYYYSDAETMDDKVPSTLSARAEVGKSSTRRNNDKRSLCLGQWFDSAM